MSSKNMVVYGTVHTKMVIDKTEISKICQERLFQILNLPVPASSDFYSINDKDEVILYEDFGSNRGGIMERTIRPATELDKAVFMVLGYV